MVLWCYQYCVSLYNSSGAISFLTHTENALFECIKQAQQIFSHSSSTMRAMILDSHKALNTVWNSTGIWATAPWKFCCGIDCAIDLTSVEILAFNALLQSSSVGSLPATRAKIDRTCGRVSNDEPRTSWLSFEFSSIPHNWFVTALLSSSSALNGSFAKKCCYYYYYYYLIII